MKIKALSEVKYCSPTIMWFYDKFRPQIADVRTVQERNGILSDMSELFETAALPSAYLPTQGRKCHAYGEP